MRAPARAQAAPTRGGQHSCRWRGAAPAARAGVRCAASAAADVASGEPAAAGPSTSAAGDVQYWVWPGQGRRQAHRIAYTMRGSGAIPLVLIHGMGACHEHWNKLVAELEPLLATRYTVYALDLLGFGDSDKPLPAAEAAAQGHLYGYEAWSAQVRDFLEGVVGTPAILIGNSAGALAALKVAVDAPDMCRGLMLLDCSMRSMHERNQPALLHPFIAAFQSALRDTRLGRGLVQGVLNSPGKLKTILEGAYGDPGCLSRELEESFQAHLSDPTSCDVLLDVFTNSKGVLPQDLLPFNTVPTVVLWGAADPWEPVSRAQEVFSGLVADFVVLPGVGHFPQDEVPALVVAMLDAFVEECAVEVAGDDAEGRTCEGFTLRGLMAAAETDPKI